MPRRPSKRRKRAWRGWRGRRQPRPPPSTLVCFRVRSQRHLAWLTRRKRRNCFRLYRGQSWSALSIWWQKEGFHVGDETGPGQQFVPHGGFQSSVLGRAIAAGRLYVLWDV